MLKSLRMIFTIALTGLSSGCAPRQTALDTAILRANWRGLAEQIPATGQAPHLRALRGQALLALNRNDEATCTLASLSTADIDEWGRWTGNFATANPRQTVARYLRGDALARANDWAAAVAQFDTALALDPKNALALNARGVVRSLSSSPDSAIVDLLRAIEINPSLGDAHNSLGFAELRSKRAADGAIDEFDKALHPDSRFVLAALGKSYAELVLGTGQAIQNLKGAAAQAHCLQPILADNLVHVAGWLVGSTGELAYNDRGDPGVSLNRDISSLKAGDMDAINRIAEDMQHRPDDISIVAQAMNDIKAHEPERAAQMDVAIQQHEDAIDKFGGATDLLNFAKGIAASVGFPLGETGGMGTITWSAQSGVESQQQQNAATLQSLHDMESMINPYNSSNPPGGVTTSLVAARIDHGDWPPIPPFFGLLYGINGGAQ